MSVDTGPCAEGEYSLEGVLDCITCPAGHKCPAVDVSVGPFSRRFLIPRLNECSSSYSVVGRLLTHHSNPHSHHTLTYTQSSLTPTPEASIHRGVCDIAKFAIYLEILN